LRHDAGGCWHARHVRHCGEIHAGDGARADSESDAAASNTTRRDLHHTRTKVIRLFTRSHRHHESLTRPSESLMPFITECPQCGQKLKVPDNLAGKTVRCTKCAGTFSAETVTATPPAAAPPPPRTRDEEPDDRDD